MKKFLLALFALIFIIPTQASILEVGISINDIPKDIFGSWQVHAQLEETNAHSLFKPQSMDFWTLTRVNDRVILNNPFSGANAEISIQSIDNNLIVFSKRMPYDNNKILTDTVSIRLNENEFSGINTLRLESYSLIDNHLMKTETATYHINGKKISDESFIKK